MHRVTSSRARAHHALKQAHQPACLKKRPSVVPNEYWYDEGARQAGQLSKSERWRSVRSTGELQILITYIKIDLDRTSACPVPVLMVLLHARDPVLLAGFYGFQPTDRPPRTSASRS